MKIRNHLTAIPSTPHASKKQDETMINFRSVYTSIDNYTLERFIFAVESLDGLPDALKPHCKIAECLAPHWTIMLGKHETKIKQLIYSLITFSPPRTPFHKDRSVLIMSNAQSRDESLSLMFGPLGRGSRSSNVCARRAHC